MLVDFERAWLELQKLIASKPQHGRDRTLIAMANIVDQCRVPTEDLPRMLRLYGVEVAQAARPSHVSDDRGAFSGGFVSSGESVVAGHHRSEEGHDGRSNGNGRACG